MKALAKVYPVLGSGRFLVALLSFAVLVFSIYLWQKPSLSHSIPNPCQLSFTAGDFSQTLTLKKNLEMLSFEFEGAQWNVAAIKTESLGDTLADLTKNCVETKPFVGFIRDGQDIDYIAFISKEGALTVNSAASLSISLKGIEAEVPEGMGRAALYFRLFP